VGARRAAEQREALQAAQTTAVLSTAVTIVFVTTCR
jgi:hypothetical protein